MMAANGDAAMASFTEDFTRDIPRGLSSRYLKQQTAPQARWQTPEVILERKALEYDPRNPGGKILIGALGNKLVWIEGNRHVLTVAGSRAGSDRGKPQRHDRDDAWGCANLRHADMRVGCAAPPSGSEYCVPG